MRYVSNETVLGSSLIQLPDTHIFRRASRRPHVALQPTTRKSEFLLQFGIGWRRRSHGFSVVPRAGAGST
jgi:hypothetical protein